MHQLKAAAVILIMLRTCAAAGDDGALRRCSKMECGQHAFSDTWLYCPRCGTALPEPAPSAAKRITVIGHVYKNPDFGFQFERPSEDWRFITKRKDLDKYNELAEVMIVGNDMYAMLIVEQLSEMTLDEYAALVAPTLENAVKVSEIEGMIDNQPAIEMEWSGTVNDVNVVYYQTIVQRGNRYYQVLCWCLKGNDTHDRPAALQSIGKSLRFLPKLGDSTATQSHDGDVPAASQPDD